MNPADLYRPNAALDNTADAAGLGASLTAADAKKTSATVSRIDTEPIYVRLKAAIGDGWLNYQEALGNFLLGM